MFALREEAGKLLGEKLRYLASERPVILGITRGGVVVAAEVAKILKAPLYPLVIKKISSAWNPEFAVGAMGPDEKIVTSEQETVNSQQIKEVRKQIRERIKEYGVGDLGAKIRNKVVVIIDDGIATGWTFRAAIRYMAGLCPAKVIAAAPVADGEIAAEVRKKVDTLVVLDEVKELGAVGNFYEDFAPVGDEEVEAILKTSFDKFSRR